MEGELANDELDIVRRRLFSLAMSRAGFGGDRV
jgi:hypothetical protein